MSTATPNRWDHLAADLTAAGVPARVDERAYQEMRRGRAVSGISRSITLRHPAGGLVIIHDIWWNKNPDVWVGWEVYREDAGGIVQGRPSRWSKKRGEVVAAVIRMLPAPAGSAS
jgi:hypothetical protein